MRRVLYVVSSAVLFAMILNAQSTTPDDPKNEAKKLFNEGNGLFRSGNYAAAIEKCKAALALDAEDYRYHYLIGLCYKNSKQYGDALAALNASVKLQPSFAGSHNGLGGVYLIQGDYDHAIESFKAAIKHDPKMKQAQAGIAEAYAGKGQQLYDQGKLEEAGALVDEALGQLSDNPKLYLIGARVYNKLERPEKALDAANQALKLKKGKTKGAEYFEIGIAYKKLKENEKARTAFGEARKDPQYSRNAQYELDGLKGK